MNEELQKAVSDMLSSAIDGIGNAADFLSAEIPLYVQELLLWKAVFSFMGFMLGVMGLVLLGILTRRFLKWGLQEIQVDSYGGKKTVTTFYQKDGLATLGIVGLAIFSIFSIIFFFANFDWLQIWLAPRVYLVEYAASLAK